MKNKLAVSIAVAVMFLMVSQPLSKFPVQSTAASGNTVMTMVMVEPPNSLNDLTANPGTAAFWITQLENPSGTPAYLPNGSDWYTISATKSYSHNSNYTIWTFNLNTDLRWSNGQNLTTADFLASYGPEFAFSPALDFTGIGPNVTKEFAVNSTAVQYDLSYPNAHFRELLSDQSCCTMYTSSFVNNGGANSSNFGTDVGLGPFYVANYTQGSFQMRLLRNPYFVPLPKISEIDISFVDGLSLTAPYLLSGSTDLAPIEPSNAASLLTRNNLGIIDEKGVDVTTLMYNVSVYPYNMTQFRQALAYGINQSQYVNQALNGYGLPAYNSEGVIPSNVNSWYSSNQKTYSYSPLTAVSLLSQIGIKKGSDGHMQYVNGTDVSLTLWTDTSFTTDTIGAGVVQQNLQSLGFIVKVNTVAATNLVSDLAVNTGNIATTGMVLWTSIGPVWGSPYEDAQTGWIVYWITTSPEPAWESPPAINQQYLSNLSAILHTDNRVLEKQYLANIQYLNSNYLPTLVLAYPDELWGYNTQQFTNWNIGILDPAPAIFNWTAFATIAPVGASTSTTSQAVTSTSVGSSGASTSTTSQAVTSTSPSQTSALTIAAVTVVVILLIAIGAVMIFRRRSKSPST